MWAVLTRTRAEAWPATEKKNCVPDRTGDAIIQYQAQILGPRVSALTIGSWQAQRLSCNCIIA